MINITEQEERIYLSEILNKLRDSLKKVNLNIHHNAGEILEAKEYIWENIYDIDPQEIASLNYSVNQSVEKAENVVSKRNRISKLIKSPYFGRIDFIPEKGRNRMPVYIGIHSFSEEGKYKILIHDWRTPLSSIFYDFDIGNASFEAPAGLIKGELCLKRQYRIRNSSMQFMIESSSFISDDVLQKELSSTSSDKMKNIVATIQKEQNAIIRNEISNTLIIQGVAGSGKTSIALHRVAYLLYRFKSNIKSQNVLIISPNKVFADYISDVLPELGEEKILEVSFEEIAKNEIKKTFEFQTFYEQVAELLETPDKNTITRIKYKASFEFVDELNKYIRYIDEKYFLPDKVEFKGIEVPSSYTLSLYRSYNRLPIKQRLDEVANTVLIKIKTEYRMKIFAVEETEIKKKVIGMFKTLNIFNLYQDFYQWLGKPQLFINESKKKIEYSDVFPFVYLKLKIEGTKNFEFVKHLVIDEMQDYTPIQYAVISCLFNCKKTILGDSFQSVNPYTSVTNNEIKKVFPLSDSIELLKSYRSTIEITNFAQKIIKNNKLSPVERHGKNPIIKHCKTEEEQIKEIVDSINIFRKSEYKSLGILCKSQMDANVLFAKLENYISNLCLITPESIAFANGAVVTTSIMAKGLEFDCVIVPSVTIENYKTEIDKNMLYVACTRAMHELEIIYVNQISRFLKK